MKTYIKDIISLAEEHIPNKSPCQMNDEEGAVLNIRNTLQSIAEDLKGANRAEMFEIKTEVEELRGQLYSILIKKRL